MTHQHEAPSSTTAPLSGDVRTSRRLLLRWFISSATLSAPQAAGPVAFSLLALSLTGDTSGGAAMILAMTLAQVVGAIPLARLGKTLSSATMLKRLVAFRTLALASVVLCAVYEAPFLFVVLFAALAGLVNGAAYGYLRSVLNQLTPASKMPRALGIAATLNEVTFVLAPVAASGLATISPVLGVVALTVVGAIPALFVPHIGANSSYEVPQARASVLSPAILLWLVCSAAGGATVAAIEIGAVALALNFGYEPALAILFTVPLCLASVAGGIWISVRNRMATQKVVVFQLMIMSLGALLAALNQSMTLTVLGALLIGSVLAPLATFYSLKLDTLAPPHRRPEVFALLRTANAIGVIFTSAVLTAVSLSTALIVVTAFGITATMAVAVASTTAPATDRPD